jgi:hypothetical protein
MLPTKTAMEVNAATSRMISVMSVSLFLYVCSLFLYCSSVNPKKAQLRAGTFFPHA